MNLIRLITEGHSRLKIIIQAKNRIKYFIERERENNYHYHYEEMVRKVRFVKRCKYDDEHNDEMCTLGFDVYYY